MKAIKTKADIAELLDEYSRYLEKNGYLDTDWWQEDRTSVERFMQEAKRFKREDCLDKSR